MARRRVGIKRVEDPGKRLVTFSKRRKRLFSKAKEFIKIFDADVAVITISEAGNAYALGSPTVDSVVQRYIKAKKVESWLKERDSDANETGEIPDHVVQRYIKATKVESWLKERDSDANETGESPDADDQDKSEMGLANFLGGSENASNSPEEKVVEFDVHSTSHSKMIPLLLGDVPQVEDLQLHELEELMAQMEEMKNKVLDRANQIKSNSCQESVQPGGM